MTTVKNLRIYILLSVVLVFTAIGRVQAEEVNGWGKFTWGMTVEEVKAIDPQWKSGEVEHKEWGMIRWLEKQIALFGRGFYLSLDFKKSEGLSRVMLGAIKRHDGYQKDFVLQVFNALKAEYGDGSSIKYEHKGETEMGSTGVDYYYYEGRLSINHIWRLKETIIEYRGYASGRGDLSTSVSPPSTDRPILSLSIVYKPAGTSDYDKL